MKNIRSALLITAAFACAHASALTPAKAPPETQQQTSIADSNKAVFQACQAAPAASGTCPLGAVFGLFKLTPDDKILDFRISNTVPRIVNQNYGWLMKLNQKSGTVRVLERFTLPEAPKSWGAGGLPHGMSADRKSLSLDVTLTVYNGVVSKSWDVAQGDPVGRHHITVFVENSPPIEFEFDVVEPQ